MAEQVFGDVVVEENFDFVARVVAVVGFDSFDDFGQWYFGCFMESSVMQFEPFADGVYFFEVREEGEA